jgi:hypothetical protein
MHSDAVERPTATDNINHSHQVRKMSGGKSNRNGACHGLAVLSSDHKEYNQPTEHITVMPILADKLSSGSLCDGLLRSSSTLPASDGGAHAAGGQGGCCEAARRLVRNGEPAQHASSQIQHIVSAGLKNQPKPPGETQSEVTQSAEQERQ